MIIRLIVLFIGVLGAILLCFGSKEIPWELRTWNGKSEAEQREKHKRAKQLRVGLFLVIASLIIQFLLSL